MSEQAVHVFRNKDSKYRLFIGLAYKGKSELSLNYSQYWHFLGYRRVKLNIRHQSLSRLSFVGPNLPI